jgi:cycloartenol synthase
MRVYRYGSWGVCFTYAAWFGVDGLVAAGETWRSCPSIVKCCEFLLDKQRDDGGWGESYLSCQDKVYSQLPEDEPSHVVNTAWCACPPAL